MVEVVVLGFESIVHRPLREHRSIVRREKPHCHSGVSRRQLACFHDTARNRGLQPLLARAAAVVHVVALLTVVVAK